MLQKEIIRDQSNFSNAEKEVNAFVQANPESISSLSVRELAKKTNTTATTVMRYCRKIGYSGFEEFKFNIGNELKDLDYDEFEISVEEDSLHVVNKIRKLYVDTVDNTLRQLSLQQLDRIVDRFETVPSIDFIVYDQSAALAEYAAHYYSFLGKICRIYTSIDEQILFAMNADPKDHLVISISRSGATDRLLKVLKILRKNRIYSVLITSSRSAAGAKYSSETLCAPHNCHFDKMGDCVFYTSVKYILDCFFSLYYSAHHDEVLTIAHSYDSVFSEKPESKKL